MFVFDKAKQQVSLLLLEESVCVPLFGQARYACKKMKAAVVKRDLITLFLLHGWTLGMCDASRKTSLCGGET